MAHFPDSSRVCLFATFCDTQTTLACSFPLLALIFPNTLSDLLTDTVLVVPGVSAPWQVIGFLLTSGVTAKCPSRHVHCGQAGSEWGSNADLTSY